MVWLDESEAWVEITDVREINVFSLWVFAPIIYTFPFSQRNITKAANIRSAPSNGEYWTGIQ